MANKLSNKLFGSSRQLTEDMVDEFGSGELHCSSEKARSDLGWRARPLRETLGDTLVWIRERFLNA